MARALAEKLDSIRQRGGISGGDVAELLRVNTETLSRWIDGEADPQKEGLKRIEQLEFFLGELSEFYAPDQARDWLFSPHKLLQGARPADRIREGRTDDVFALLDQLRSGAFV